MAERRTIAALAYPGLQLLDIVGPLEAFNLASQQLLDDGEVREHAYRVTVIGKDRAGVRSMSGLTVEAERNLNDSIDDITSADTMRYAFVTELDVTPSDYRQRFGHAQQPENV